MNRIMSRTTKLLAVLILSAACLLAQFPTGYAAQSTLPPAASKFAGGYTGVAGVTTYYYWLVTRYIGGAVTSSPPVRIDNAAAPLAPAQFVTLSWYPANGTGITYDVLRTAAAALPSPCTCLLVNTAATTVVDNGGALGAYGLPGYPYQAARASWSVNNRDYLPPVMELVPPDGSGIALKGYLVGQYGSIIWNETPTLWTTNSELRVGGLAGAYLDWSAQAGILYGVSSRVSSTFTGGSPTTLLYGADFRARSLKGAAPGLLVGVQGYTDTDAGTVGNDLQVGTYGVAAASVGIIGGASGARGDMLISGTATMAGPAQTAFGVKGYFDDQLGLTIGTNYTAATVGWITDRNTVGPTAAVMAYLDGGGVRTAGNSPSSAFRVVDANIAANAIHFNYGFDAYWVNGATGTVFKVADVRGMSGDTIDNIQAGIWRLKTGATNIGVQPGIMGRANINGWAAPNGVMVYCSDCTSPAVGAAPTAWAATCNAGAGNGALAIRQNNDWLCY